MINNFNKEKFKIKNIMEAEVAEYSKYFWRLDI